MNIILKNYLHVKGYPVNQNPSHSSFCSKRKVRKWSSQWLSFERSFFSLWLVMRPLFNKDKWVTMSLLQRPCSGSPGDDEDECVIRHELGVLQL